MTRVASLYLPQLPIERLRRIERPFERAEPASSYSGAAPLPPIDDDPGACSVPRGGWRPGARWARDEELNRSAIQARIEGLPAHQRPTMHEMGRRSEAADNPFRTLGADDGSTSSASRTALQVWPRWARPLILVERVGQRDLVMAACPVAHRLGILPGMVAAQARAQLTELDVRPAEAAADRALLERLALHAVAHWTPIASVSGPDGLWLDLTGTTHLFGGEERFCMRLLRFLRRLGLTASVAVAGTPGAAHAMARYSGSPVSRIAPGEEAQALAPLPLAALRLESDALASAARFGLERIGELYAMPRAPLAKRLGVPMIQRLDQARGVVPEPIIPVIPFEAPRAQRRLLEPIMTPEAIAQVIADLVDDLVIQLGERGLGLRAARLACDRVDRAVQSIAFGASRATRDPRHIARMLIMRIERIEPGLGIESMTLHAAQVEPLAASTLDVGLGGMAAVRDVATLIDQLAGRVGEKAVFRMAPCESDVPERAVRQVSPLKRPGGWPGWRRPVRLLAHPEAIGRVVALLPDHPPRRFEWRGHVYHVVAGDGPERIHGEWWRRSGELWAVRDYFAVETQEGARLWLFRRGDGVDAPTGDMSWYVHGLFG